MSIHVNGSRKLQPDAFNSKSANNTVFLYSNSILNNMPHGATLWDLCKEHKHIECKAGCVLAMPAGEERDKKFSHLKKCVDEFLENIAEARPHYDLKSEKYELDCLEKCGVALKANLAVLRLPEPAATGGRNSRKRNNAWRKRSTRKQRRNAW